jgi:perosamine synthetase
MIAHSKPYISSKDSEAVTQRLMTGMISEGDLVAEFENKVSKYVEVDYCIATSSGVSALSLAYKALAILPGDEIIIPSYVCLSVAQSIMNIGAIPVLCDVSETWCMTFESVQAMITPRTKAIVLVHMFGINSWDKRYTELKIPIIEDNCQAFGYEKNGEKSPLQGDFAIYSFHATKCLTTGEGGMLATRNLMLFNSAKRFKDMHNPFSRMTDLQAALGISQLEAYDEMKFKRKRIANNYFSALKPELLQNMITTSPKNIFFRFVLTLPDWNVDKVIIDFSKKGIAVRKGVDALLHRQFNLTDNGFDGTVRCFDRSLSIPIYPALKETELECIIDAINNYF